MKALHIRLIAISVACTALGGGCATAAVVAGTAAVALAHDRRTTGTQVEDEALEWKGRRHPIAQRHETANVSFTAFNRTLLLTGEVPDETARREIAEAAAQIDGVERVIDELAVAPVSGVQSRTRDALVSANFKARVLRARRLSANHVKPVTERGVLYLMGLVNDDEAREAIEIARTTAGAREVVNLIEILPEAETRRIDAAIFGSPRAGQPSTPR